MKTGSQPQLPAVVLCVGPEKWLQARMVERLKRQCLAPGFEEMDFIRFPEPPEQAEEILAVATTAPFGSPARLVVVEGYGELNDKTVPWLKLVLTRPHPHVCLVLCAEKAPREIVSLASREKGARVQLEWCQVLKGAPLKQWLLTQAHPLEKELHPAAADLLILRLGSDLQALASSLESLSLLVGSAAAIVPSDVEALIAPSVRETAFDILDQAASGRADAAIGLLRQALAQGRLTVEQFMGALGWYYRMIWKAKSGAETGLWISPQRRVALNKMNRWQKHTLQRALEEVLEADAALKWGTPAPELLADELLLKLASG